MQATGTGPNYRLTVRACYLSNFLQGTGAIFAILFVPLRTLYGLSYAQLGLLVSINFVAQVVSDVLFSKPVERFGFRPFAVLAPVLASVGLLLFGLAPLLFPNWIYGGFVIATVLYAAAGGLQELLLSPILDSIPMPDSERAKRMSMLHSLFAWGQIFVVLVTTLLVSVLRAEHWPIITLIWAILPLYTVYLFARAPLESKVTHEKALRLSQLLRNKIFWLTLLVIVFGGAAEVTMAKWASVFLERGVQMPKLLGDTLGVCGYALMLALGRTGYGIFGDRISIHKVMIVGSVASVALYALAAFSGNPAMGIALCALVGLGTSMLWPGSIVVAAREIPLAGASMFALLSAAGDVGAAAGSYLTGWITDTVEAMGVSGFLGRAMDAEQAGLRYAMLFAALYPLLCLVANLFLLRTVRKGERRLVSKEEDLGIR